jgi:hypothetical protein
MLVGAYIAQNKIISDGERDYKWII